MCVNACSCQSVCVFSAYLHVRTYIHTEGRKSTESASTYMLKINLLVIYNVAMSLHDIMHVDVCLMSMFSVYLYARTYVHT